MRFVHESCLNEWRVSSANPRSFARCDQCGFAYRTRRSRLGDVLQSERTHTIATLVVLLLLFLCGAMVPYQPERGLYALIRWQPRYEWHGYWGDGCDAAVRGLALPATAGMLQSMRHAYR